MAQNRAKHAYDEHEAHAVSGYFDAVYYLARNPDLRTARADPLTYFLTTGWREGRNPSPDFDVTYYLRTHADVAAAGINPLVHYAQAGALEGRLPRRPLDVLRSHVEMARSPRAKTSEWADAADCNASLERQVLARRLASAGKAIRALVVSVSHDDYDRNLGGVQNVLREERAALERMGCIYLHLSPAAPLPLLAEHTAPAEFRFRIRLGSDYLGVATAADLLASLAMMRMNETRILLIVHHMLGHAPEVLQALAAVTTDRTIVWIHDYFTLCSNYNLLRNDVRFCGAPPVAAGACGVCVYGAERAEHVGRIRKFFEMVQPVVLAPSETALDFWRRRGDFSYSEAHVQPLARLVLDPGGYYLPSAQPAPLRVAHLGMRGLQKGWPVFEKLAQQFRKNPAYAFYQLGAPGGPALPGGIRHVDVRVNRDRPDAMIEAIAEHRIDVVVSWSLWPETFCYAVHEALAGGAFVLARAGAGNVALAVLNHAPDQGRIFEDEGELFSAFEEGRLGNMVSCARPRRGILIAEHGSAMWVRRSLDRSGAAPRNLAAEPALSLQASVVAENV